MPSQHKYMFKKLKPTVKGKMYKDYAKEAIVSGQYAKTDFDANYGTIDRIEKDHLKKI